MTTATNRTEQETRLLALCQDHSITLAECEQIPYRTDSDDWETGNGASHWRFRISRPRGDDITGQYSRGSAHRIWSTPHKMNAHDRERAGWPEKGDRVGPIRLPRSAQLYLIREHTEAATPDLVDIIGSLLLNGDESVIFSTFEEWCADYGLDDDSRRAEYTYNACRAYAILLNRAFGDDYPTACEIAHEI